MGPADTQSGTTARSVRWLVLLFSSIALLAGWDVLSDLQEGTTLGHVAIEIGVFTVAMLGALWTLQRLRTLRSESQELRMEAAQLQARLSSAQADARHFQNEVQGHVRGLSQAIDNQFEAWGLTQAEKQVALLPLKGLSHKEIGAVRGVSEATVRQQSRAVYKKGNLSGRHDLAAFFLEDLLAPSQRSDTA